MGRTSLKRIVIIIAVVYSAVFLLRVFAVMFPYVYTMFHDSEGFSGVGSSSASALTPEERKEAQFIAELKKIVERDNQKLPMTLMPGRSDGVHRLHTGPNIGVLMPRNQDTGHDQHPAKKQIMKDSLIDMCSYDPDLKFYPDNGISLRFVFVNENDVNLLTLMVTPEDFE